MQRFISRSSDLHIILLLLISSSDVPDMQTGFASKTQFLSDYRNPAQPARRRKSETQFCIFLEGVERKMEAALWEK